MSERTIITVVLTLLIAMLICLWVWQTIWGLGGIYTHVRYISVPPNLTSDSIDTPLTIDGVPRRWRRCIVNMSMEELVELHHLELPKRGWAVVKEGFVTLSRGEFAYCLISQQRHVTAYISIRDGRMSPEQTSLGRSAVVISIDKPDPPYCDYDNLD